MARTIVAIPAHNEEITIGTIVLKARQYVDEVVVVDDGSTDKTREVARLAEATVLTHIRNLGKGSAIRTAFNYAKSNGYEALVLIDGDGQHDCNDIPLVLRPVLEGRADLVIGTRVETLSNMPSHRRAGKGLLDLTTAVVTGYLTDSQCGFRALSQKAIHALDLSADGFGIESEMIIRARHLGMRIVEIPIKVRYDSDVPTMHPIEHGIRVLGSIFRIVAKRYPLFSFGLPGIAALTLGILLGIGILQVQDSTGILPSAYGIVIALIISGILSMLAGYILSFKLKLGTGSHQRD